MPSKILDSFVPYSFNAYGHSNITATHKTTVEFTKDKDLSLKGSCILGVNADFELEKIKNFIKSLKNSKNFLGHKKSQSDFFVENKKIKLIIKVNGISEEIIAELNPDF